MKILVAGSSGLIGSALVQRLTAGGDDVVRLVRRASRGDGEAQWDPDAGVIDEAALLGVDGVVHLGGASIASKRWNAERKAVIRSSRVDSTRLLSETLASLDAPPSVFACASALGYYGDSGDAVLTEDSPAGNDFLARATAEWEAATDAASGAGIRVVNLRIGVVLSAQGDLPRRMLTPFKLGLGGKLGSGQQYMSWVHLDDVVGAIIHALHTPSIQGPVNVSSPNPVTNAEFTRVLAELLHRPAVLSVPAFALRAVMGEMASFALSSARLHPRALLDSGYEFLWQELTPALRDILEN